MRPGKRERLVASATDLLHRHGVERTTLAKIAQAADVPPGNVYYYFKTRDELVRAVIDARADDLRILLNSLDDVPTPAERLRRLALFWADSADTVAAHGCPIGSLCSELNKQQDGLATDAAKLFGTVLDWVAGQFQEMGRADGAELAVAFLAGIQGAALLANTMRDPRILIGEVGRLERWVDSLA